ncbi:HNH endonuclease [Streptomyces sp. NBC_01465]|uniref:HNH endonuclease n=1 Tax=Streptomyces sp. NBC_01465 TaxID=2903878 RepID=UPI002E3058C7|nr:hypothetical protein [Streptomyces sp. NBC_01465]
MLHIDRPVRETAREAFQLCTSTMVGPVQEEILSGYEESIVQAADVFGAACEDSVLHLLDRTEFGPNPPDKEHTKVLIGLYDRRLRGKRYPGRSLYDQIRNAPGKCPLCGIGRIKQVDHHLPKAHYPFLAVAPDNLIPVCADCNTVKLDRFPTTGGEQSLHPYYDDIEDQLWLRAELLVSPGPGPLDWRVRYYVDPHPTWSEDLADRVRFHFEAFELDTLYAKQCADELVTVGLAMEELFVAGGAADVQAELTSWMSMRSRPRQNNWMAALYRALAGNPWYCDGGFQDIAAG